MQSGCSRTAGRVDRRLCQIIAVLQRRRQRDTSSRKADACFSQGTETVMAAGHFGPTHTSWACMSSSDMPFLVPSVEHLPTFRATLQSGDLVPHAQDLPMLVTVAVAPDLIGLDINREQSGVGHGGLRQSSEADSASVLPQPNKARASRRSDPAIRPDRAFPCKRDRQCMPRTGHQRGCRASPFTSLTLRPSAKLIASSLNRPEVTIEPLAAPRLPSRHRVSGRLQLPP